ncbi:LamG domain-containing protein [Pseudarthrobacter sp. MM222]|uniref:LamG domain-containing protein n=1 Tax=Pseudarthrobacter sp. MM222 TaxID=3018929 RepID=UPI00221E6E95|nr:LamG domain-containing protein [Pseudarthrobacter sp. MM222]CAI3799580.1 hypothetical protein NKCBBBOE_02361 [Pseudarthrobacter sp. MM222]
MRDQNISLRATTALDLGPKWRLFRRIRAATIALALTGPMIVGFAPAASAVTCDRSTAPPTNSFPGKVIAASNFESGKLKGFKATTQGNGSVKVASTSSHSGACAAFLHATTANNSIAYMQAALPGKTTEVYADGWFNITKAGVAGNNVPFFRFFSSSERVIDLFRDNASGAVVLRVTAPNGTFSYTTLVPNAALGTWHHVAMHIVANGTATGVQVWYNEQSVHASKSVRIGAKSLTAVQLGAEHDTQMGDTYADDVIVKAIK